MARTASFALAGLLVLQLGLAAPAHAGDPENLEAGKAWFEQQGWEEARALFEGAWARDPGPETRRYLALTLFHLQEYEKARPLLEAALDDAPGDRDLRRALAAVLLAFGESARALETAAPLLETSPAPEDHLLAGRIQAALGRREQALEALAAAWEGGDVFLRQTVALERVRLHQQAGDPAAVRAAAEEGIELDPGSFGAGYLHHLMQGARRAGRPYSVHLGQRFESDSNVTLEPAGGGFVPVATDESDTRNVFFADVLGRRPLGGSLGLFGEIHLSQSLHDQLGELDLTRQVYVGGIGWSRPRVGVRVPVEWAREDLDGERFRTAVSVSPGVYYRLRDTTLLYGFLRLQEDDFAELEEGVSPAEDRSGTALTAGALVLWSFAGGDGRVRGIVETGRDQTEGANWERDRRRVYGYAQYRIGRRLEVGLGGELQRFDHDNPHDVFRELREDRVRSVFATVSYRLLASLEVRAQVIDVSTRSTLDFFTWDRTVTSVGFTWHH